MKKNFLNILLGLFISAIVVVAFSRFSKLQEVNSLEINKISEVNFNNPANVLIDVRTANEYKQGYILNAKNYDVMNFGFENSLKNLNKNANYYIYCRSGSRSLKAYNLMKTFGYKNLTNLEGGIQNYAGELTKD